MDTSITITIITISIIIFAITHHLIHLMNNPYIISLLAHPLIPLISDTSPMVFTY